METLIATENKQMPAPGTKPLGVAFVIALTIFFIVFLGTVGLKLYTIIQDQQLEKVNTDIANVQQIIATLKNNPDVNAYSLWDKASKAINMQIQKSEAQLYLARFDEIARNFFGRIAFSGFSYSDGKIETSATAYGTSGDAALNVVSLLRNYRGTPATPDAMFGLDPVLSLSGDPTRRDFSITFDIKNTLPHTNSVVASSTGLTQ